jgi:type I restriction enzyme S subunit
MVVGPSVDRLIDVAVFLSGGTPRKGDDRYWVNGTIPWLTPKDMGRWTGETEASVTIDAIGNGTRTAPDDAIFLAVRGMSLHKEIRLLRATQPMSFNQDIKAIVPKKGITQRYLFYAIQALKPDLLDCVEASGHGTGTLPTTHIGKLAIPRFSHAEEYALGELFAALDDKIELNRRMNETLEASARALFRDWFVDFGPTRAKAEGRPPYLAPDLCSLFPDQMGNDGVPEGWEVRPLDRIAEFLNGLALQKFPPVAGEESLPVIKIAELRSGITPNSNRAATSLPAKYIVNDGDFLFSWSGSLLAKFWTEGRGALNQHLFKVSSTEYPKWFYSQWVWHHLAEFQAIAASKATTMGHIQRGHLSAALTICPPHEALSALGNTIQPFQDQILANLIESRTLAETRDALLPKLMSGEIRVRDAEALVAECV